jgi:lycopene cyclase domain-containing protein
VSWLYLGALLFSMTGMGILDWRWRLALFHDTSRTIKTVSLGVIVFLIWDLLGIKLGIFFVGNSAYDTGILLAPNLPLEELFFLTFLCYFTLIVYQTVRRRPWQHI